MLKYVKSLPVKSQQILYSQGIASTYVIRWLEYLFIFDTVGILNRGITSVSIHSLWKETLAVAKVGWEGNKRMDVMLRNMSRCVSVYTSEMKSHSG
ncbi:hypothetical protein AVEN_186815-1 [Araneus ventricosus]|uniref:Uncharacterized protein n=1 Tax=Araneus ventricosus TaxID=182803 RepID=A0A4Y2U7N7_ARAVE|nr:hypothetical protein AVEN_135720-1 [Araneus ventricosus]GBO08066.1 hypothetical protein AVEN_186815-1 [Araneus ventricosus]